MKLGEWARNERHLAKHYIGEAFGMHKVECGYLRKVSEWLVWLLSCL